MWLLKTDFKDVVILYIETGKMKVSKLLKYVNEASDENVMLDVKYDLEDKKFDTLFIFEGIQVVNEVLNKYFTKNDFSKIVMRYLDHEYHRDRISKKTICEISRTYGYECWNCLVDCDEIVCKHH